LAKIAAELETALAHRRHTGAPGRATPTPLAAGPGWSASDVLCTCTPSDRPFQEQHASVCIALVLCGTFRYRGSAAGRARDAELMTPGSVLLGNPGQCFECGHDHAAGDRCLSFHFTPDFFDQLAFDAGATSPAARTFHALRLPPLREFSRIISLASAALLGTTSMNWAEIALTVAAQTIQAASALAPDARPIPPGAEARVTRIVRDIGHDPAAPHPLLDLAARAGLSPFHFLRTFQRLTGVTPHQYALRTRLRAAALRLATSSAPITEIAYDSGFADLSNFNRTFRAEFGATPRAYRRTVRNR
jgi:AraC family transcriptional regulator